MAASSASIPKSLRPKPAFRVTGHVHESPLKSGLRWRDAPAAYGPHKTLYNRFIRWSRMGVFSRIFAALAEAAGAPEVAMIDATPLKAHRTASSLLKKV